MNDEKQEFEQLLAFLYAVPVGLIRTDFRGRIFNMNPSANSILAVLAGGAPSDNAFEALHPALGDLRHLASNAEHGVLAENLDFPLGPSRTLSLTLHAIGGEQLAFILTDVTERVRQRRQIMRRERELRSIFETVQHHMIVLLDEELRIQEYNTSIRRLTNQGEEVIGDSIALLFHEPPDLDTLRTQAERAGWTEFEGDMVRRGREPWWGDSVLSRIPDAEDRTVGFSLVTREASERRKRELRLEEEAYLDGLTGLPNRRRFDEALAEDIEDAVRQHTSLGLLLVDIDLFKQVNDEHGHPAGDAVLIELADRLRREVRGGDTVARLGGEEFAIIAPEAGRQAAVALAERCRGVIASTPFRAGDGAVLQVTVSIGITLLGEGLHSPTELYQAADAALYRAKELGRNRTEFA